MGASAEGTTGAGGAMVVAVIVFKLMYQVEVAPLIDAEKQIDDATK